MCGWGQWWRGNSLDTDWNQVQVALQLNWYNLPSTLHVLLRYDCVHHHPSHQLVSIIVRLFRVRTMTFVIITFWEFQTNLLAWVKQQIYIAASFFDFVSLRTSSPRHHEALPTEVCPAIWLRFYNLMNSTRNTRLFSKAGPEWIRWRVVLVERVEQIYTIITLRKVRESFCIEDKAILYVPMCGWNAVWPK